MTNQLRRVTRALLSVSDKTGLIEFARALAAHGVEIVSTGGTAKAIAATGLKVTDVSDLTGFPEMMDGRVKTLHPKVHGGLLAVRSNTEHDRAMKAHGIAPIDLLVVNLYPFEATVEKGADFIDCIENIDIGGPAMIRAAAKNHDDVAVVVEAQDYAAVLEELAANEGATTLFLRRRLAAKAYARTAAYDAAISNWFANELATEAPDYRAFGGRLIQALRYGENPHQNAAFYRMPVQRVGVATARQVQGKELSYNNINDTDAAYECIAEFDPVRTAACVIVKHANPCGVAEGADLVSAYGGIIAVNRPLDAATAAAIAKLFAEVVIAPAFAPDALGALAGKNALRILAAGALPDPAASGMTLRSLAGGYLLQSRDNGRPDPAALKVVTQRMPTSAELADLHFAFTVAKHVKSNAIVYAKAGATVGIGAGQMSRVDSARIAAWKAEEAGRAAGLPASPARGSVVASDAFFPFADGLEAAVAAGATAVIQPGGSVRDRDVIAAADQAGVAMVFTGLRHFRH